MKKATKCIKCKEACIDLGVGFASTPVIFCTLSNLVVSKDDGCTLGSKGEPKYWADPNRQVVDISGHEAV